MKSSRFFKNALIVFLAVGAFSFLWGKSHVFEKEGANFSNEEYDFFILGKSFFRIPWVEAPSATTARDGLGPLFNANTCTTCHPRNGRGFARREDGELDRSVVVKLSAKPKGLASEVKTLKMYGTLGDKSYGRQVQVSGVFGVPHEAIPRLHVKKFYVAYPDGKVVELERPYVKLTDKRYGEVEEGVSKSLRFATALVGMGYIDMIDEEDILSWADPFDENGDGVSGKPNYVYSHEYEKVMLGRFNLKASTPTLKEQIALAFHDDMGISNSIYPGLPCTNNQEKCLNAPTSKDEFDITPLRLEAVNFYVSSLALPKQKITNLKGKELFESVGCVSCHRPSYTLANGKTIHPYSDFLLHDMGEGLADGRVDFEASGKEWRTQPLWGLSHAKNVLKKSPRYLHDGRARSLEEAILWHGGEALRAKLLFMGLHVNEREALIKFLKEL